MNLRSLSIALLSAHLFLCTTAACAQDTPAKIVSVRASAKVVSGSETSAAEVSRAIRSGDELQTDSYGRMSLLLPDDMLLKVSEGTHFLYEGHSDGAVRGTITKGKVWLRGQKRATPFEVVTPTATAAIRGTEWYMEVAADGTTTVGVLDGIVAVSNAFGSLELQARELSLIEPGRPPVKLAYVTPPNAVNWTLNYFGLWDVSDLELDGKANAASYSKMIEAYYASDLKGASTALQNAGQGGKGAAELAGNAFLLMVSGNSDSAKDWFERARRAEPSWALPLAHLSLIALVENDLPGALRYADDALQAQPASAVAHIAKAYALKGMLILDAAYEEAKQAVALAPTFQEALLIAAQIALEMERLKDAATLLSEASDTKPPLGRKRTLQGFLALRTGTAASAIRFFEQAITYDPDAADAFVGLGIGLFRENQEKEAIAALVRATLVAPQVSEYQSYLAKAYAELGNTSEAMQVLARAKRLDPKDPTPYLYEALLKQAEFQPGQAFLSLREASKRNDNRAVFRSQYLLDQDRSLVTSNLAQVYHEIGFDYTATQEAARALEIDPTNQGAHRRQFFALQFDPRGYAQAASSERLLNNLFAPATRSAVVLNEDLLSPYQNAFDRPGIDPILRGRGEYSDTDREISRTAAGTALVAAQLEQPVAFSLEVGGSGSSASSSAINPNRQPKIDSEERDMDDVSARNFIKWQPTASSRVFGDFRYQRRNDERVGDEVVESMRQRFGQRRRSLAAMEQAPGTPMTPGSETQPPSGTTPDMMPPQQPGGSAMPQGPEENQPPGMPMGMPPQMPEMGEMPAMPEMSMMPEMPSSTPGTLHSDMDSDQYDFSGGLYSLLTPSTHALFNASYRRSDDELETRNTRLDTELRNDQDSRTEGSIVQGALWQRFDSHFFQLGARYFDQDSTLNTADEEEAGMPQRAMTRNDERVQSAFLVDQFTGIPDVVVTLGMNVDRLEFELVDGRERDHTELSPSIGASWEIVPAMHIRAAAIHNAAGDRDERLQQTFIAGFPWQRLTLIEPYTEEQFFNLEYESYALGWDVQLQDPTIYLGVELERDRERTQAFAESGEDEFDVTVDHANRGRIFLESLLTPQWAAGLTYRYDRFEFPSDTRRHSIGAATTYFTPWQLAIGLKAQYVSLQINADTEEGNGDKRAFEIGPTIQGYPLKRMRVNFDAPIDDSGNYSIRLNFFWYLSS